jgi:hypothetical protein
MAHRSKYRPAVENIKPLQAIEAPQGIEKEDSIGWFLAKMARALGWMVLVVLVVSVGWGALYVFWVWTSTWN